jgi:hypothetical protein
MRTHAEMAIAGAGSATTCGDYVNLRRTQTSTADSIFVPWLQGFLSGINANRLLLKQKTIDIPEPKTLALMVESYCVNSPSDSVWITSLRISNDLIKKLN